MVPRSAAAWIAAAGEGGTESADWRAAWGGGLLTTCGLDNVGAASESVGLHGTYTFLPARSVLGRSHDRAEGTLPFLEPREERSTRIAITAEEMD